MEHRLQRKLTAIPYADVASYSRLTGEDEAGTHRTLRDYLDLISSTIQGHSGRVVHYAAARVFECGETAVVELGGDGRTDTATRTGDNDPPAIHCPNFDGSGGRRSPKDSPSSLDSSVSRY